MNSQSWMLEKMGITRNRPVEFEKINLEKSLEFFKKTDVVEGIPLFQKRVFSGREGQETHPQAKRAADKRELARVGELSGIGPGI